MQARTFRPRTTERREGRGRYVPRRRACVFCVEKTLVIDYKDVVMLRRFMSDRGRIETRRRSGSCAKHQRTLAKALKRARHLALIPFTAVHLRDTGAINVINPEPVAPPSPGPETAPL